MGTVGRLLDGDGIELGTSDDDIQQLENWFRRSVAASTEEPARLANRWYAVVNDIAVGLGDILVTRCPDLHWEFFIRGARSDMSYQKHVITGLPRCRTQSTTSTLIASLRRTLIRSWPANGSRRIFCGGGAGWRRKGVTSTSADCHLASHVFRLSDPVAGSLPCRVARSVRTSRSLPATTGSCQVISSVRPDGWDRDHDLLGGTRSRSDRSSTSRCAVQ